jgi:hypothetical protein
MNRAMLTSKHQDWGTDDEFFARLHEICRFTTDACALASNAKLEHFITPDADGLNYRWFDLSVFYNPEYRWCSQWMPKARNEAIRYPCFSAGLVPYRPDPEWWSKGVLSEDGAAGPLLRSFYDPKNRVLWLRFQKLITGVHSVPGRLGFKLPAKVKLKATDRAGKAPFPSAVIFHIHPRTPPPTRRWLLERCPR